MDGRLQGIIDHHEITQLIAEYCRGCDRMDRDRMAGVYTQDSIDDHGSSKCSGQEFADISMKRMALVDLCSHHLCQTSIRVDGDAAGAETHFIATVRRTDAEGNSKLNQLGGRYVDRLSRIEGQWRIKHRTLVRDWSISHAVVDDWLAGAGHIQGRPSAEDPCYDVLALTHSGPGPT